ncbi:MAG: hypothetical protein MZV65_25615 [Chromatiales bacterium]|nr:hypothetical protein [Chromatiales bacterium]
MPEDEPRAEEAERRGSAATERAAGPSRSEMRGDREDLCRHGLVAQRGAARMRGRRSTPTSTASPALSPAVDCRTRSTVQSRCRPAAAPRPGRECRRRAWRSRARRGPRSRPGHRAVRCETPVTLSRPGSRRRGARALLRLEALDQVLEPLLVDLGAEVVAGSSSRTRCPRW